MRYQTTTELTPSQALEQALANFGPDGVGLQITSQTNLGLVLRTAHKMPVHTVMCLALQSERGRRTCTGLH